MREIGVDSISVVTDSADGRHWSPLREIGPVRWSFWRVVERKGAYYSAAYDDGNLHVRLFRSSDGERWTEGPLIDGASEETPSETELVFMPSGRMLGLVRLGGVATELLGHQGRLRTRVCWSEEPYDAFVCPQELSGVRLDGAVAFFWKRRLFVVARKHIPGPEIRKRAALYEITGTLDGGPIGIVELGELPSAGDTAYAGAASVGRGRFLVSWYSSDVVADPGWLAGLFAPSDVWLATIDLRRLPRARR